VDHESAASEEDLGTPGAGPGRYPYGASPGPK